MLSSVISFFTDPANTLTPERKLFSNTDLCRLIVPLFFEQFLALLVGIADTLMISYAGDAAVSGVSLVNQYNTIFLYIFSSLASGGAVVVSQYIGSGQKEKGSLAAGQMVTSSFLISIVCMLLSLVFYRQILGLLFGRVEAEVMRACVTYLIISALSYPAMAVYNSCAALYRSMGKTKTTMCVSLLANLINVAGNAVGIFALHAGVAGVALPSLISRVFQAAVMAILCFRKNGMPHSGKNGIPYSGKNAVPYSGNNDITLFWKNVLAWDPQMIRRILHIAVPNGVENGIFQLVKVALSSIVALFGTAQIAANGVAQSIWCMAALMCSAFPMAMITVAGQCMGAGDTDSAEYYIKKMTRLTVLFAVLWNGLILAATPLLLRLYALSDEARNYTLYLVIMHNTFNGFVLPLSGCIGSGLRAAGDVKFAMRASIGTTLGVRMVLSVILGLWLGWGVFGVAAAMCLDWTVRGILFARRFRSGKWKNFKVI